MLYLGHRQRRTRRLPYLDDCATGTITIASCRGLYDGSGPLARNVENNYKLTNGVPIWLDTMVAGAHRLKSVLPVLFHSISQHFTNISASLWCLLENAHQPYKHRVGTIKASAPLLGVQASRRNMLVHNRACDATGN